MLLQDLVQLRRGTGIGGRERLHILLLYQHLSACITSPVPRVRELVQDILTHAGASLGLYALPARYEQEHS